MISVRREKTILLEHKAICGKRLYTRPGLFLKYSVESDPARGRRQRWSECLVREHAGKFHVQGK